MASPSAFTLSAEKIDRIRNIIDASTSDPETQLPSCVGVLVDRNGDVVYSHASGFKDLSTKEPMTLETLHWYASCTKLVTTTACMQLVERGVLDLDDEDLAERVCPELQNLKVLDGFDESGKPILVEKQNKITMRMLLTHTAGFSYVSFSEPIRKALPERYNEIEGPIESMCIPLLFQPGTGWNYGINTDFVGFIVERLSGLRLEDYFQRNIFQPLGITDNTMFPQGEQLERIGTLHLRNPVDGKVIPIPHLYGRHLESTDSQCHGGTSTFGLPAQYMKLLAALLNNGKSPKTGQQILNPHTVDLMFTAQTPQFTKGGVKGQKGGLPFVINDSEQLCMPGRQSKTQGWSFAGMVEDDHENREPNRVAMNDETTLPCGENTVWWAGVPNLYWWIDRETGVAGIVGTHMMPWLDPKALNTWKEVLEVVYSS
ncbi:beta-lactamase/transpeptidase-like protein [Rhizodiscina lignyota]|uniref:Beta-lactamase/transpeptidase-like protein n=1 Tax=Rhizodiscina lignyota TaxID=1504668 RepID=A0A9P4MA47_9PEZI|nr:beta-lactamase/transpeptidase-like protein [Rhizodiscina lignyota]